MSTVPYWSAVPPASAFGCGGSRLPWHGRVADFSYRTVCESSRLHDWSVYRSTRGQNLAGKFSGLLSGSWAVPADGSRVCPGVGCGSRGEARWSFGVRRPGSVYGTHVRSLFRFLFSDHLLDPLGGVGRGGVRQRPRGVGLTRTPLRWSGEPIRARLHRRWGRGGGPKGGDVRALVPLVRGRVRPAKVGRPGARTEHECGGDFWSTR